MSTPPTVYEALSATARRRGTAPALVFDQACISYEDLMCRIDEVAVSLLANGIGRGDAFALYGQNCPEFLYCYYAAAKLGAVYVPINPNMTATEVRYIFTHSAAKCVFHDALVVDQVCLAVPADKRRPMSLLTSQPSVCSPLPPLADVGRNDDFIICYTSGTTGTPKAVVLDHQAQVAVCESLRQMWDISPSDVTLVALPMGFLYGLSTSAAVTLSAGGVVAILPKFRPRDVLEALGATKISVFHGVPTMFSMMLEYTEQNGLKFDLSGVRHMISAGAPLSDEVRLRFARTFHKSLQNYYAMTECTPVFGVYATDPVPVPTTAIGKKAPGVSVKVVGSHGEQCGPGVDGEFHVRAPAMLKCYRNDPELTATVLQEGWFRSGDLGHYDADGYYYITGRIKDIIIRGGANIAPTEVEQVLIRHPAIQDVAVVGVPDRIFGEVPIAFVVRRGQQTVSREELIAHARADLADFKVPQQYFFLESLPLGKTGKVDKNALRAQWQASAGEALP